MSIPPRFLNELRDRLTLSDVIGKRVRLTRAGREFKGCCPFHNEKTPSFTVNDDKQFYHCFGCGAHGDVINFVIQHDNLSFIDAIESLAAEAGMQVPQQSPQEVQKARQEKSLYSLMEDATKYFEDYLQSSEADVARRYLKERGMSEDLMRSFRIGFSPADRHKIIGVLKEKGYTEQQMLDAGLLRKSQRDGSFYAFFRGRIMFPVMDMRGRIVAFGGRILPDHLRPPERGDYTPAKYMNSSDSSIFHKGRMLYGESQARQAAVDGHSLIVVEGYVDVMACVEGGFRGAVAPMGTALTDEQILKLWKMIPADSKVPVLCFDGDNAGRRAAFRACENILPLLQPDHSAKIAFLPDGQDPDSLIKGSGAQAFRKVMEGALPLVDFIWNYYTQGRSFKTPEERAGLTKIMDDMTARISNRTVQHYYKQVFRDKLYHHFRGQGGFGGQGKGKGGRGGFGGGAGRDARQGQGVQLRRPVVSKSRLIGQVLLVAAINHPALLERVEDDLMTLSFENNRFAEMRDMVIACFAEEESEMKSEVLQAKLSEAGYQSELDSLCSNAIYTHAAFCRPESDIADVFDGWDKMMAIMHDEAVAKEIQDAGKALAQDFSAEIEERMLALRKLGQNKED